MRLVLPGIVGAPGLALGRVARLAPPSAPTVPVAGDPLARLAEAQRVVAAQLQQLAAELRGAGKPSEAAIFEAHALLAADPLLAAEIAGLVAAQQPLDAAILAVIEAQAAQLRALDDEYLRERAADLGAVGAQLVAAVRGTSAEPQVPPGAIVVAAELTPSEIAALRKLEIGGIATSSGSATGHVAILARALELPAVVGLGAALLDVPDAAEAVLDAEAGQLIVAPQAAELAAVAARQAQQARARRKSRPRRPAQTADGERITLWANIGHPDEAHAARTAGAEGIGLFRTEFLFLDRPTPPDEDEQFAAYARALAAIDGPLIVRTFDIGGDKPIPYLPQPPAANPFLGWRGLRFAMHAPELFQTQLRALLRAARLGDLRLLLPMVATPDDVAWARAQLDLAAAALTAAQLPHRADVDLGIMVETPAAALTLDRLAAGIRFCSIGSNDLAQYTLAADRTDGELAQRYRPTDPAIYRLIRQVVQDARRLGLELSLCGELAADPAASVVLVGLGLRKLSMTAAAIPAVKDALRRSSAAEAGARAAEAGAWADAVPEG